MSLYSKIDEVMDRFDFDKVHRVMKFLNWTWYTNPYAPPTIDDLKSTARECLCTAVRLYEESQNKDIGMTAGTGGFHVTVETFAKGSPLLSLMFYVDQSESF